MPDGYGLGNWVAKQRMDQSDLSLQDKSKLSKLDGWIWDVKQYQFETGIKYCSEFIKENGHCNIPVNFKTADGYLLGSWVRNTRRRTDKLDTKKKTQLRKVGFTWDTAFDSAWNNNLKELKKFHEEKGDFDVPKGFVTNSGPY